MARTIRWLSTLVAVFLSASSTRADGPIRIVLENSFIDQYADRATITATYTIDKAKSRPNPASKDGDLHIAGRAPEIGLPCVAELMNGKFEKDELKLVKDRAGTGTPVSVTGAWRLWCEHAGTLIQRQKLNTIGTTPFDTTNPDHVFEVHPIVSMDGEKSGTSWTPIDGFQTKDAHASFVTYENVGCKILPLDGSKTELRTWMAGYNYVEFIMEREDETGHDLADGGRSYFCRIRDMAGDLLVRKCRVIFAKDTEPFKMLAQLDNGERMHVLGIPRISLALVRWRVQHKDDSEGPLTWNLPYEIVIAAAYEPPSGDEE